MRQSRKATNLSLSFATAKVVINQKIIYLFTNFFNGMFIIINEIHYMRKSRSTRVGRDDMRRMNSNHPSLLYVLATHCPKGRPMRRDGHGPS